MKNLAIRTAVNAVALWVAAGIVDGINLRSGFFSILFVALIFGIVNALIKPLAIFLALPAIMLTLGLFTVVVNAAMLGLTAWLTDRLDISGFWSAIFGALIISVISWAMSIFLSDKEQRR